MTKRPGGAEYEEIVERLVGQLSVHAEVRTERIVRDVKVAGRSTVNQIDVLWDFVDAQEQPQRVVFEARSYSRPVVQGRLHEFRSVVDDIQDPARPVKGVMVTTVGYQRGAKRVASTYNLVVLELRSPNDVDLANRLVKIVVSVGTRIPIIENIKFGYTEVYDEAALDHPEALDALSIAAADDPSSVTPLADLLCRGELGSFGQPRPIHYVRRDFDPPALLLVQGRKVALLEAIAAQVGDVEVPPVTVTIGGPETIAWMLRDSLDGSRVWIAQDGQVWTTDS